MLEQLKKDFPSIDEEVLKQVAEEEGLTSEPEPTEQEEETSEPAEQEEIEESEEETEEAEPTEQDKKVPLKALHEERNKRKALSAQLEAIKAEIESIKNRPAPQQQEQLQQKDLSALIEAEADKAARKSVGIDDSTDIESLTWSDPPKYRKYIKEVAKAEIHIESAIQKQQSLQVEVNKFTSQPDFREIDIYAGETLNELPLREARPIQMAVEAFKRGNISNDQIDMLKGYYTKCQDEYRATKSPNQKSPANKIAEMAKMPRASQLSGQGSSRSLSTAELETMLDEGRFEDIPPEVRKKYMR